MLPGRVISDTNIKLLTIRSEISLFRLETNLGVSMGIDLNVYVSVSCVYLSVNYVYFV